jgi:Ca2+-binding EF-hand superfamily protein
MTQLTEKQIWNKLYDQMDRGLITYTEMMNEYAEFIGFNFQINEGIAR